MRYLLDTHVLLWWLLDDEHLDEHARSVVLGADDVVVSVASIWEIVIKNGSGRLRLPVHWRTQVNEGYFTILPVGLT